MSKIITTNNCSECPYKNNLFSKNQLSYCTQLSKIDVEKMFYSLIPVILKKVNIPKKGILKNCPLNDENN